MNKKLGKTLTTSFLITLLFSAVTTAFVPSVFASQNKISVTPRTIIDQALTPPKTFKLNVTFSVTDLYGFEYKFRWNKTLLDCTLRKVNVPSIWYDEENNNYTIVKNIIQSDASYSWHWLGISALAPAQPFTGNWTICEYTFKVKSIGSTSLELRDTKMSDQDVNPIIHTVESGWFSNARPSLELHPLHHLATDIGQVFPINITISNVNKLYGYEFKLFYDTVLLTALNVELPSDHFLKPLDPLKISITRNQINDNFNATHGQVWFGITLLAPEASKIGSGILVKVNFITTASGGPSPLKLAYPGYAYPVKLYDPSGNLMPCTAQGGLVTVVQPPSAKLYVDPSQIVNSSLTPCNNFTVSINILNATEVYSWEIKLFYENAVLNATDVAEGSFLNSSGSTKFQIIELNQNYNSTHGIVWLNCTLLMPPPIDGQGTLAIIAFHVETTGETKLDLTDTILKDSTNKTLTHYTADGYFNNMKAHLFVDPPSIVDPTIQPPAYFNISVKVANVTDLYAYEFKLGYNTTILNCLGAIIIPFDDETNFLMELDIDDAVGLVWLRVIYCPPAKPFNTTNPVTLAKIFFQVAGYGESVLDLYDTKLLDSSNMDIPHRVSDGYIKIFWHDVAIVNVVASTNVTHVGRLVYINVTAENQGDAPETFNVSAYYDVQIIGSVVVVDLAAGASITLNFVWDTGGVAPCHYYNITGKASIVPYETDVADNVFVDGTVKLFSPDVAIVNVVASTNATYVGRLVYINVTAENQGVISESFDVSAYFDAQLIGTANVTDLVPGANITLNFVWDTYGVAPCHRYNITGKASILPYEVDVADNVLIGGTVKIKMVGDLNGDGIIDIFDVVAVGLAFGSRPGDPNWDENADIIVDNFIDIFDLVYIGIHFGEKC